MTPVFTSRKHGQYAPTLTCQCVLYAYNGHSSLFVVLYSFHFVVAVSLAAIMLCCPYRWIFRGSFGNGRLWSNEKLIERRTVMVGVLLGLAHLFLADNDTVPISMWRGGDIPSTE